MKLRCTAQMGAHGRRREANQEGQGRRRKRKSFSLSVALKLFSSNPSWDCTLTVELFYQQILHLKIAGVSARQPEQGHQRKLF